MTFPWLRPSWTERVSLYPEEVCPSVTMSGAQGKAWRKRPDMISIVTLLHQVQYPGLLPLKPAEPGPGERQRQPGGVQRACARLRLLWPSLRGGRGGAQGQGEALNHRRRR